jgi:hypothetical protein
LIQKDTRQETIPKKAIMTQMIAQRGRGSFSDFSPIGSRPSMTHPLKPIVEAS